MSATNRGSKRIEADHYPTQERDIIPILWRVNWAKVASVTEPCKGDGDGAILSLIPHGIARYWFEIREDRDYLASVLPYTDITITNPPFNLALDFIRRSLVFSKCSIYLLRLGFLASAERKEFLTHNPPTHLYTLSQRPSFVDVCKGLPEKRENKIIVSNKVKGCGMAYQKKERVKRCTECGGNVSAGTDACDYAWMCWDYGQIMVDAPGIYFL